jgi:REP element-mobilizing transposase RayT
MNDTIGIHWIATTHGSWLHGDPRGSWREGRLIGPDPFLESSIRTRMTQDAVCLGEIERELVAREFGRTVQQQGHRVFAGTIQSTHLHLVFAPLREEIKTVIARLKRRSASVVLDERRKLESPNLPRSIWTHGQFAIFIFEERNLVNAIEYVRDHNRRVGLSPDPYNWIEPLYPAGEVLGERFYGFDQSEQPRI